MTSIADQHQNRDVLLGLEELIDDRPRARLISSETRPIALQVKEFSSLEDWRKHCQGSKIPNTKFNQILALESLQNRLQAEQRKSDRSLHICVPFENLPPSKKEQYEKRLRMEPKEDPEWNKCHVRLYTSAEWAFETWARSAGLDCIDLNIMNLYDPQDYEVDGRKVDVKATISVGFAGRCELKCYWSPDGSSDTGEIICAVRSEVGRRDELTSRQYIQGIFHPDAYREMPVLLKYFTLDGNLRNACYFHSPHIFFKVKSALAPPIQRIDEDVIEYCVQNSKYLPAVFHLMAGDTAMLLREVLPPCHQDFALIAAEMMSRGLRHLLPHYLADYILDKILNKRSIDPDAIEKIIWSVFMPNMDQKKYLQILMKVCRCLPHVRCAHHPDESIGDMDIDITESRGKLILYARCGVDPSLKTTFLAYSWKTLEVLVYRDRGISVCDAPRCGCLTHLYRGKKLGKRTCTKYGEAS